MPTYLYCDKPVAELESKLAELKKLADTTQVDVSEAVIRLEDSIIPVSYTHLDVYKRQTVF